MGQESLEKVSIEKYLYQWNKELMTEIDKQYLKDHFMLGDGGDQDKMAFYQLYLKTFSMKNCELSEWVWKKINGTLEESKKCKSEPPKLFKNCSVQKIIKACDSCDWQTIYW
jgi:hypothetical protein|nr:MAG TPA: hypothetical protein [Caudoviricetes sp.]